MPVSPPPEPFGGAPVCRLAHLWRFLAMWCRAHSAWQAACPRREKRVKPLLCLSSPNCGSIVQVGLPHGRGHREIRLHGSG